MAATSMMLWLSQEIAKALPVVKETEPVMVWDNENRRMTDEQAVSDGLPVWRTQALIGTGWGGDLTPVEIRIKSKTRPEIPINTAALLSMLGAPAPVTTPTPGGTR